MRLGYRPALDGLRAVAIGGVVLYHATGYPAAGYLGVDLFFVLSGFLITTILLEEHARNGGVSIRGFYLRRVFRLLPALLVLLGVVLVSSIIAWLALTASVGFILFGIAAGLGYASNFVIAAGGIPAMPSGLQHLWSLAAEEQFYLVWPLVLFIILRARLALAAIVVTAAIAFTLARQLELVVAGAPWHRLFFGVDTRSTSILVGCLLALALASSARNRMQHIGRYLEPAAVGIFCVLLFVDLGRSLFAGPLLVVGLCCAVLIMRALDDSSAVSRLLAAAAFVFLGRISYSLYLWHIPVFTALGVSDSHVRPMAAPAIAIALICAIASYYLVELPFLRRKQRPAPEIEPTTNRTRRHVRWKLRRESPLFAGPAAKVHHSGSSTASA